jgi:hypothetical protein
MELRSSDLFLLDKWDSFGGEATERRAAIFKEYVRIGTAGRWVCFPFSS